MSNYYKRWEQIAIQLPPTGADCDPRTSFLVRAKGMLLAADPTAGKPPLSAIEDSLTNLMHLCTELGTRFESRLENARSHFRRETKAYRAVRKATRRAQKSKARVQPKRSSHKNHDTLSV